MYVCMYVCIYNNNNNNNNNVCMYSGHKILKTHFRLSDISLLT